MQWRAGRHAYNKIKAKKGEPSSKFAELLGLQNDDVVMTSGVRQIYSVNEMEDKA